MKNKLLFTLLTFVALCALPGVNYGQVINLGTAKNFVLFTTVGAITNTGTTHLTGHVGSNVGSSTNFGNVDGVMNDQNGASAAAGADLLTAYGDLSATIPTLFPGTLLGNGITLTPGVYSSPAPTVLSLTLNLDAQGNSNAVFIFKIGGAFSASANAKVKLLNGAKACNVYWVVEGLVSMASGTTMRGTVIANNAAITMSAGDTLEGRALSINGAISVTNLFAYTPVGCGSPTLTGPANPALGTTECFSLFTGIGALTNAGPTHANGDIGTNSGLTTGFNPLFITGAIHPIPDGVTSQCGTDFTNAYNNMNLLPHDIQLLYPAQFGNNLTLTPHTYWMNGAVTFTDSLYLNAMGNANAVFVIKVNGAFATSVGSKVILINGAQAKNVYWKIDGAVNILDNSVFCGTILAQGAINLFTNVTLNGRALTGVGEFNTYSITVNMPTSCAPFTMTEPINQTACIGSSASFSVTATGIGLNYQWRKGNVNLVNGGSISGVNSNTLTINPVSALDAATNYNVIITGDFLPADTSNNASLIINAAPSITTQPTNQTACAGNNATFTVVASGSGLTYQWRKGLVNIGGETNATLTLTNVTALDVAANYNVVVLGTCLPNATSNNVSLTLTTAPTITTQPTNETACLGGNATFSVVANGSGLTYQWRKGLVNIGGETNASLTITNVTALDLAINYNVVVSGTCLPAVTSNNVSLTLTTAPSITTQPTNETVCAGADVTFTVVTSGSGISYQWREGTTNILGETNASFTINNVTTADAATNYNVVVTGACLPIVTSNSVSLTVNALPIITTQPTNQIVCAGNNATFTVVANGTGLSYQWRNGLVNIVGETNASLTITNATALDESTNYNVVVSGTCLPIATSNNVSLTLTTAPSITTQPTNETVCAGDDVTFTVVTSCSGISYQWREGTTNILGETNASFTINNVTTADAATNYNVVVTGACLPVVTSNSVSLTVNALPIITTQPTNQIVCAGNNATFTVVATGTGLTYQWRKGLVNILGETNASLTITNATALDEATNYNVVVSGTCLPTATSNNVSLTLTTAPSITTQPTNETVCAGADVTFTVVTSGSGISYQWREGSVDILNATNANYTINNVTLLDAATSYNVVVTGACLPVLTSNNVSLTVQSLPSIVTQPTNQIVCAGNNATFTVVANGTGISYQWRKGLVNIVGETNASLTITNATALDEATNYNVVVSGTCLPAVTSTNVSLTLTTAPSITTQPTNETVCAGADVTFTVISSGSGLNYQWRKGIVNITGETSSTLTLNNVTASDEATNYNVIVIGACAPNDTSNFASLTLIATPSIVTQATNQTVCPGDNVTFTVVSAGAGLTYQWRKGLVNIVGETNASLTINNVSAADVATNYNVIVSGTCSPAITSTNVSLSLTAAPTISTQATNQTICAGDDVTFSVVANGTGLNYQWRNGTTAITGATTSTLTINNATTADASTSYNVVVSGTCAPNDTSDFITLVVNMCSVDLSVVKTSSSLVPSVGTTVQFTIVVTNNSSQNATNVSVDETLQSGFSYVSSTTSTGTFNTTTGIWTIGTLASGASETMTITAAVITGGIYTNTAIVGATEPDLETANNSSTVVLTPIDFHIPDGFSPNGDGINDLFVIRGISGYPTNEIAIYNRWGTKVFDAAPYANNWDGKSTAALNVGNDVLPVGTYFYILDLGNGSDVIKGTIYLNK